MKDFLTIIKNAKQLCEPASTQELPAILYWNDGDGEHCIAPNEQVLHAMGKKIKKSLDIRQTIVYNTKACWTSSECGPLVKWPKTPASHAGNTGSNPVRVTTGYINKCDPP